jgi:phage terminase small subunit
MAVLDNPRYEAFAKAIYSGKTQSAAYREAFPSSVNWKDKTVANRASELASNGDVLGRIKELKEAAVTPLILDRQGRMLILTEIAMNEQLFPKPRMQAIDLLNKMTGEYIEKRQIEAIVNTPIEDAANRIKELIAEVKTDGS